jgi:hypothetical protein
MIKVVRTSHVDYLLCPICTAKNFFIHGTAPIVCKNCNFVLPDACDLMLPSNFISRIKYHQDEMLYD